MIRDDIIRMAREAGYGEAMVDLHLPALIRFAALVAAAEREKDTALLLKCLAALGSGRPDVRQIAIERLRARLEGELAMNERINELAIDKENT